MNEKNAQKKPVPILLLSIHQEMGEALISDVCGKDASTCEIDGKIVTMDVLAGDPRLNASWEDAIKKADGLVILTRYLDMISLDKVKAIYRRLPGEKAAGTMILIVREMDEADFKMSCPVCGQKLWVRDGDAGKRGRCPNCKKAFTLPDQVDHLRAQLALPDSINVFRVKAGDAASAKQAFSKLLSRLEGGLIEQAPIDQNVLKQSTIRVQVNPEDS